MSDLDGKVFDEKLFEFLSKIADYKKKLLLTSHKIGRATCPRCGTKNLVLQLKGTRDHFWAKCRHEGCNFAIME